MIPVRQSTAFECSVGPVLDAEGVAVTDCVVGDFKLKKTTGNFAALNGSATLTHVSAGTYDLVLTTSDVDTVGLATVAIDDTVNACAPVRMQVIEEAVYDALYAASAPGYVANAPVSVAQWAGTNVATPTVAGVPEVDVTHVAGSTTDVSTIPASVAAILVDTGTTLQAELDGIQADTEDIQTRLPAALVGGRIDATVDGTGMEAGATAAIADAVWLEAIADHSGTAGSTAEALSDAGGAGTPPTVSEIADAVWDEAQAGHVSAGSFGVIASEIADILVDTAEIGAAGAGLTEAGGTGDHLTALATAAALQTVDNEIATIDSNVDAILLDTAEIGAAGAGLTEAGGTGDHLTALATAAALQTVDNEVGVIDGIVDQILADTGTDGVVLSSATLNAIADALLDRTAGVETSRTPRQALRLILAAAAGKLSGAATTTVVIRDTNDTVDRITATVDADGNRSSVTLDAS